MNELLREAAGVNDPDRRIPRALARRLDDTANPPEKERTPLDAIREHIDNRKKNRRPL